MGAQETPAEHPSTLSFSLGAERLQVIVVSAESAFHRGRLIDTILTTSSLRTPGTFVYLAAPRILGTVVEAEVFQSHGIGLLLFDERRIQEFVAPQTTSEPLRANRQNESGLANDVELLRTMYAELERNIGDLREELQRLRNLKDESREMKLAPSTVQVGRQLDHASSFPGPSSLPSFFENNPWLEVLSKRGVGEDKTIAA